MGLVTKEVEVGLSGYLIPHFKNKGYDIPEYYSSVKKKMCVKAGTRINVDVNDLPDGSEYKVDIQCDKCGEIFSRVWHRRVSYLKRYNEDLCSSCIHRNAVGENSPRWNPNISNEERITKRHYQEYQEFVQRVLARDGYKDRITGEQGVPLVVHHLDSYTDFPEKRLLDENGITLSKNTHNAYHQVMGYSGSTREKFEQWLGHPLEKLGTYTGELPKMRRAIYCIDDDCIFDSVKDAAKYIGCSVTLMDSCLLGHVKGIYGKRYIELDKYNTMSDEEKKRFMYDHSKASYKKVRHVILLNDNSVYDCLSDAARKYPNTLLTAQTISSCCMGKTDYAGFDDNGMPLQWAYLEDYQTGTRVLRPLSNLRNDRLLHLETMDYTSSATKIAKKYNWVRATLNYHILHCKDDCGVSEYNGQHFIGYFDYLELPEMQRETLKSKYYRKGAA